MAFYSDSQWVDWVDRLAEDDYLIVDNFLPSGLYASVKDFFFQKMDEEEFKKAGIGAAENFQVDRQIRGDFTYWIDKRRDRELDPVFALLDETVAMLNRYCFLSLSGYEFHLAHYPAGTFYRRHLDQFEGRSNRMISFIVYFNDDWQEGDGGELKIFRDSGEIVVPPLGNRLAMFRSAELEHEVLETFKSRLSLTGWLLYQPSTLGYLLG